MRTATRFLLRFLLPSIFALTVLAPLSAQNSGQVNVAGDWLGRLEVGDGIEVRIVFHIVRGEDGSLTSTIDSPDQGANGIPTSATTIENGSIEIAIPAVAGKFEGSVNDGGTQIEGTWAQGGASLPLVLHRVEGEVAPPDRPQEPKEPLPYAAIDVTFENTADGQPAGITLAGTLTVPEGEGPFPGVVLVSGSGPQNRNEELLGHKPFLVLSDYLTRQGIAVLRYDDRGVGKSTGSFVTATSADFATDALAAVQFLSARAETDPRQIGIAGHSEGGLIAPLVGVQSDAVAFIVLMAGPGLTGEEILYLQGALIARANGASEEAITRSHDGQKEIFSLLARQGSDDELLAAIEKQIGELSEAERAAAGISEDQDLTGLARQQMAQVNTPWFRYFLTYDPIPTLERVEQPVLAINGEKDLQVPPHENLEAIEAALRRGGNEDFEIVLMAGLNHLFQEADTGSPAEYARIEQTFSPQAMKTIADWILRVTIEHAGP